MAEIFETGDPGIDVKDLMARIRESIKQKKEQGVYTDEELASFERMKLSDTAQEKDYFAHTLQAANAMWRIEVDRYRLGIPPKLNRPGLAHAVIWSKKIIRRLLRFHTRATFYQQIEFNSHMVQVMNGLHEKLVELENSISDVRKDLEKMQKRG